MWPVNFNPPETLRNVAGPDGAGHLLARVRDASLHGLRDRCQHLSTGTLLPDRVAAIWLIGDELQRRGVGPFWHDLSVTPINKAATADAAALRHLARWRDLLWLRIELGPSHVPPVLTHRLLFAAEASPAQVEAVCDRLAQLKTPPVRLLHDLGVPSLQRLALAGLVTTDVADRRRVMRRRVLERIGPGLEALGRRPRYALTAEQIAQRLAYVEAIELARGSPTSTARVFGWITGRHVTPAAVDRMRSRLGSDLGLTGKSWRPGGR